MLVFLLQNIFSGVFSFEF